MENQILFFVILFLAAVIFALAEIQIEGKHGWAAKLPTWRYTINTRLTFFNREITGYHTFIFALVFLLPHFAFVLTPWTLGGELYILAFYILLNPTEDFLWFVLNPNYRLNKFTKEHVKWHKYWFLNLPFDYWITIPTGIVLFTLAGVFTSAAV